MSILAIAFPAQSAIPVAQTITSSLLSAARPLFGLGLFLTLLMVFKPLLIGILRAGMLLLKPRQSLEQRSVRSHLRSICMLNQMANDFQHSQPNVSSELRAFAARD